VSPADERNGYDVSYQSDVYTSYHHRSLFEHRLIVVAGHDEYWTHAMRDMLDAACAAAPLATR
jgi:acyl transferase domain-containing protein